MEILNGFGKNMANMPDLTPESANSFSNALFERTLSNLAAIRELDEKIAVLDQQISKFEGARVGTADGKATVTIVANEAGPARLKLMYRKY